MGSLIVPLTRFQAHRAQDQAAVSHPDVDSPFEDERDVVSRLLPYHIFQQPRDDLEQIISGKGKERAANQGSNDELLGMFANSCWIRL